MKRPSPEDSELSDSQDDRSAPPASTDSQALEVIFRALAQARGERTELVDDVRTRMDGGEYMSAEKLNLAIHRMLKDSLA